MIAEQRQTPRLVPVQKACRVPVCRVEQIGPYGLYFAYNGSDNRPAPGTNYLYAWLNWCSKFI
jgi:hypothetical protein